MRAYKTKPFARKANNQGLTDKALYEALEEVQRGLFDANLGGNLYKKRIGKGSRGKSGGFRVILVYKASKDDMFCIELFAKNEKDNISSKELDGLQLLGKTLLGLEDSIIQKAIKVNELQEVLKDDDGKKKDK